MMLRGGCGAAATAAALAIPAAGAVRSPNQVRVGHAPRIAASAKVVGTIASGTRLRITVALRPQDAAGLALLASAVSTPGAGSYRDYLTRAQFARRFGASPAQLDAVESSLRAHGLSPGAVSANRLSIELTATAGAVGRAFSVSFRRVELASGRQAMAASSAPALDAGIAGDVQAILGLSTVSAPQPLLARPSRGSLAQPQLLRSHAVGRVATGGPQPCSAASTAAGQQNAYTADQVASSYRFSGLYEAGDEGQGETIAVFELEPNDPNDITAFQQCYGTSAAVSYVPVDGGAGSGPGEGEAALDIEQAIGLAPRARILVYQGPNSNQSGPGSGFYDTWSAIVSQDRAQVITDSWGQCEAMDGPSSAQAEETLFEEAAVQGQSIVTAAGDEGSEDCNGNGGVPQSGLAVDDPASQLFVTGVGGTTLSTLGPPPTESVWNGGGNATGLLSLQSGAGGGGVSALWKMPPYQSAAPSSLHLIGADSSGVPCATASGDCREVPDVSADADPNTGYIIYFNGSHQATTLPSGWQAIGGTSAAAPVWAALLADIDSDAACHGSPVGFANPALYSAAGSAYASDFNDVTSGNNDYTGTNSGLYPAGQGYDMASGLGTPNAAALALALCAGTLRVTSPGPQTSTVGQVVRLQVQTTAPAGTKLSYKATGLPAGLSIASSTGKITGRPTRASSATVIVAALGSDLSLRGTSFHWVVEGKPAVSHALLTGVGSQRPKLQLTLTAGRYAPALSSVSIGLPAGLRFARSPRRVAVSAPSGKRVGFSSSIQGGWLLIALPAAETEVRITVSYAAIAASGGLAGQVRSRRTTAVRLTVVATDASRRATTVRPRVRLAG